MTVKVIKDKTLPATWKRIVTKEHKYIAMQSSNTSSIETEIYHSDDCTLNNLVYLFTINGSIEKAKASIGHYEYEQQTISANNKSLDEFIGLEHKHENS